MPSIRIGSPDSPVLPGTPVPGSPGKYYEAGQFAPSVDELATSTFSEAQDAGLLSRDLPIFDEQGKPDKDLIDQWNPYNSLSGIAISSSISKFSMGVLLSVNEMWPNLYSGIGITSMVDGDADMQGKAIFGSPLITAKTVRGRSTFQIYSPYYQYMTVPIVPEIPGRTKGISVSTYATLKASGHALFNLMSYQGEMEYIGRFLNSSKWSKDNSDQRGSFLGRKNMGSYFRENGPATSEVGRYSPVDDFSDTFAQFLCHRQYLASLFPEKLEVMEEITEKYGI